MLRETQTIVAESLLDFDGKAAASTVRSAAATIRAGKLSATRRLEIYRHNVNSNLRGVMQDIYPVVLAVVGENFFLHAADRYIQNHPSASGDLNRFGGEWAVFLGQYPHAADLPYLSDVARLEWAWHEAFHGGERPALDVSRLAAIPPEEHGNLRFKLHPTVRLLQSHFPVQRIWDVNQPTFTGEIEVNWESPIESLLIHRDSADGVSVLIRRIGEPAFAFLSALQRNASLEEAASNALEKDDGFDLQGFLLDSIQSGVITDFMRPDLPAA